jgi:hypothetical protein
MLRREIEVGMEVAVQENGHFFKAIVAHLHHGQHVRIKPCKANQTRVVPLRRLIDTWTRFEMARRIISMKDAEAKKLHQYRLRRLYRALGKHGINYDDIAITNGNNVQMSLTNLERILGLEEGIR